MNDRERAERLAALVERNRTNPVLAALKRATAGREPIVEMPSAEALKARAERCRTCGTYRVRNPRTGRLGCPARSSHPTAASDVAVWRGILRREVRS